MPKKNKLLFFPLSLILGLVSFFILASSAKAGNYPCDNSAPKDFGSGLTGYCTGAIINGNTYNIYCGVPVLASKSVNIRQGNDYYKTDASGNIVMMSDELFNVEAPALFSDSKIVIGQNQTVYISKAKANIPGEIFPNYTLSSIIGDPPGINGNPLYLSQKDKFFLIENVDGNANTTVAIFDPDGIIAGSNHGNVYTLGVFIKEYLAVDATAGNNTTGDKFYKPNLDPVSISPPDYNVTGKTIDLNNYFSNAINTYPLLCRMGNYGGEKVFSLKKQCYDGSSLYQNTELSYSSCKQCQTDTVANIKTGLKILPLDAACNRWCADGTICKASCADGSTCDAYKSKCSDDSDCLYKCVNGSTCQAGGKCDGTGTCYECVNESNTGICQRCNDGEAGEANNHTKYYIPAYSDMPLPNSPDCSSGKACDGSGSCKLKDDQTCSAESACISGDCNAKPDGNWFCGQYQFSCINSDGTGANIGDKTCYTEAPYELATCSQESVYGAANGWAKTDCLTDCDKYKNVDTCLNTPARCQVCPSSCSAISDCKDGNYCDGICKAKEANGFSGCDENSDCQSNTCRSGLTNAFNCVPSGACNYYDQGGSSKNGNDTVCYNNDVYTCNGTSSDWNGPTDCAKNCGLYKDENSCSAGACAQCKTDATGCSGDGDCKLTAYCNSDSPTRHCAVRITDGGACMADNQCNSGSACKTDLSGGANKCEPATSCLSGGAAFADAQKTCNINNGDSYTCNNGTWSVAADCGIYVCNGTACAATCTNANNVNCVSGNYCYSVNGTCQTGADGANCDPADKTPIDCDADLTCNEYNGNKCVTNGSVATGGGCDKNVQCASNTCNTTTHTCVDTGNDINNCGGAGVVCSSNNITSPTCSGGVCNGVCNAGSGDCNGDKQTDGCEINLNTNASHCGSCNNPANNACGLYVNVNICNNGTPKACSYSCSPYDTGCDEDSAACVYDSGNNLVCTALASAPKISTFNVNPFPTLVGGVNSSFTISWTIDGGEQAKVNHYEVWRKDGSANWAMIADNLPATTLSYADAPAAGNYQYGLHMISNAGSYGTEETSGKSPISVNKVECTADANCDDSDACTKNTCTSGNTCDFTSFEPYGTACGANKTCDGAGGCSIIKITNCPDLQNMENNLSASYELANDIDCSGTSHVGNPLYNSGAGFIPIGDSSYSSFTGTFDGRGFKIFNLYIHNLGQNVGLFGYIRDATIENIGLINVNVSGGDRVGGLVGFFAPNINRAGIISNSYSTGVVSGNSNSGGLVGFVAAGSNNWAGEIFNSYSTAVVSGLIGIGGLAGFVQAGPIVNSYATGAVSGSNNVGGLVGGDIVGGTIMNSYATGAVSGSNNVGGLAGVSIGTVVNSYATGAVSNTSSSGGLAGLTNGDTAFNSYWNTQTSGQSAGCSLNRCISATGLTTADMIKQSSYSGWDFTGAWKMVGAGYYPCLQWQDNATCIGLAANGSACTLGSQCISNSCVGGFCQNKCDIGSAYLPCSIY